MTQNPYSPLSAKSIQLFCLKPCDSTGMLYLYHSMKLNLDAYKKHDHCFNSSVVLVIVLRLVWLNYCPVCLEFRIRIKKNLILISAIFQRSLGICHSQTTNLLYFVPVGIKKTRSPIYYECQVGPLCFQCSPE